MGVHIGEERSVDTDAVPPNEGNRVANREGRKGLTGGMDDRKSEGLVVPVKRGNPPQGTPQREGDAGT